MPVDYSTLPDKGVDYSSLPDKPIDYAGLPDQPSANPLTEQATKETRNISAAKAIQSFKTPAQMQVEEQKMVARDFENIKPLGSAVKTAAGFVEGFPQMIADTAKLGGGSFTEKLGIVARGGVQTAQLMQKAKDSPIFSQDWWDAVVPLSAQAVGEVAGVRGSAPALETPLRQQPEEPATAPPATQETPVQTQTQGVLANDPQEILFPTSDLNFRGGTPTKFSEVKGVKKITNDQGKTVYAIRYGPNGEFLGYSENPVWENHENYGKGFGQETQKEGDINVQAKETQIGTPEGAPPPQREGAEPESVRQPESGQQQQPLRDEGPSEVTTGASSTPAPAEPVVSAIANKYTQDRMASGDLGNITPGESASVQDLATRGQKIVEQQGEGIVDQAVSRVMSGTFDPINDSAVVRFQEARLRARKDAAYRELQADPSNIGKQQLYDNAFKDLTDFHQGPVATVKSNWAQGGRGLQGSFPVDLSTADGLREAWLQNTGKDMPEAVRPVAQKVATRVRETIDSENGAKAKLGNAIENAYAKRTSKLTHEQIRDRYLKELENRPCL